MDTSSLYTNSGSGLDSVTLISYLASDNLYIIYSTNGFSHNPEPDLDMVAGGRCPGGCRFFVRSDL